MASTQTPTSVRIASALQVAVFMLVLITGGALSFIEKKIQVSEIERRSLSTLPKFSWKNLFYGKYTDSLDLYYADNFPYRESWVRVASALKDNLGYQATSIKIYYTKDVLVDTIDSKAIGPDSSLTLMAKTFSGNPANVEFREVSAGQQAKGFNRILIHNNRAFNSFSPVFENAVSYGAVINSYRRSLGSKVAVYCMVVPSPNDFYLPKEYRKEGESEEEFILRVRSSIDSSVIVVNPFAEMRQHASEYLYFNTDHHWTARGAYYAYRSFCTSANLQPFELAQFTRGVKRNYLGSLYGMTLDKRLRNNQDSVEYFMPAIQTKTLRYPERDLKNPIETALFKEIVNPVNSYLVFLGGDYPFISVQTKNHNGRKLLLVKDSFGNAAVPFFAMHYETVYIIDYRLFDYNIVNFAQAHDVTDMIFLHNTFVVNASFTGRRELYLMRTHHIFIPASDTAALTTVPKPNEPHPGLQK